LKGKFSLENNRFLFLVALLFLVGFPVFFTEFLPISMAFLLLISTQIVFLGILAHALSSFRKRIIEEKETHARLASHAKTMLQISEVLNSCETDVNNLVTNLSAILEEEFRANNIHCVITPQKPGSGFMPPSGGRVGVHIPLVAEGNIIGTMNVTRRHNSPLLAEENQFFSTVAQFLAVSLHRLQLKEQRESVVIPDFQLAEPLQPSLPEKIETPGHKLIQEINDHMDTIPETDQQEICHLKKMVLDEISQIETRASEMKRLTFEVEGAFDYAPPLFANPTKMNDFISSLLTNAVEASPVDVIISVEDQAEGGEAGALNLLRTGIKPDLKLALMVGANEVEKQGGTFQVISKGPGNGRSFTFSLPANTTAEAQAV
jgi:hypothetical protein